MSGVHGTAGGRRPGDRGPSGGWAAAGVRRLTAMPEPGAADPAGPPAGPLFPGTRLHVVTGKGGTGKTTVATALALALARGGRRVLLCEVEGRQGLARLFGTGPLPYEERRVATTPDGGEVLALAVEPRAALLEYLRLFYRLGGAGRVLDKVGALDFATTVAPGVRDVLLTGKVYEAVRRRHGGRAGARGDGPHVFDAVVLDAPPTGRVGRFLGVTTEVHGLARVGPIAAQAASVAEVLRSPSTRVHLVTLLEEMPVQETLDAVEELTAARLRVGAVVVDQVHADTVPVELLDDALAGRVPAGAVLDGLVRAGVAAPGPAGEAVVEGLLAEAAEHDQRLALQEREHERLAAGEHPLVELPRLPRGVDRAGLDLLADRLVAQGLA